ncbi:conserved hypothetical protein [Vibrio chagasii]|uniref:hypothetical protein n=1 Tax=Vibrio TaxID=662 RepID=UPI00105191EE|nr:MULTISPECIES: hypothetical protein [Vibrio]CAH6820765.1 conserved hypothetical protein [Vibrio chagasii]TCT41330.1 hypothetical protein EDB29_103123 [Vibrio crassostreae]TKF72091.1 hypothetical protein FCV55_06260 [Vibrio sp. F13]CAH6904307.1 conserved hypothetical protein [Vibrio chagasii]CAH6927747.1 conserved hypothetical protein [Vibrio chagasii]
MTSSSIWITFSAVFIAAFATYLRGAYKQKKREANNKLRRESISILIDDLPDGINEHVISGVIKRPQERFLASGVFTYSPACLIQKAGIKHKSRVLVTSDSIVVLDWDSETRWTWNSLQKIEMLEDGFTIYPKQGASFKFIADSTNRPELEVMAIVQVECVNKGSIKDIPILPENVTGELIRDIKTEFMKKFDSKIRVNIENLEALTLYTEISNDDHIALSDVIKLLKTLD